MGSPLFDWIILREHFQLLLILAAVLWVLGIWIYCAAKGRAGSSRKMDWSAGLLLSAVGPLFLGLWFFYNAVMDYFGLDSVLALILNLIVFLLVGLAVGGLFRAKYFSTK